ncbi:MAG TPA: CDP-alcohol phosphatidyltransferase family protein [Steroidobacteraceae bacterium]|nr:CDP-alcohol phosphatidyltransferase family protein [Steroidobacteraceae bacterium]
MRHLPNIICLVRLALIWPVATALYGGRYGLALALFVLAAISDGVDGYLAKRFNWISDLGKFLDPAADKLLLVTVFIESTWLGLVPWWVTAAAVARDVMIALGALVYRVWFGPLRGRPTIISKINTAAQLLYLTAIMLGAAAAFPPHDLLRALALTVFTTTVLSGLNYVQAFTRRAWTEVAKRESDSKQRRVKAGRPDRDVKRTA